MNIHAPSRTLRSTPRGFTLIDLLVAIVVLGMLIALAWPAYREQVARARRVDAQAALLEDAAYLQRYVDANASYRGTAPPALPATVSPRDGVPGYAIRVDVPAADPSTYVLTAVREGAMAGDRCGDLTYDDLGRKGLAAGSAAPGLTVAACWR